MEEGVVNSILRGPLAELFDSTQQLTDVSGSGNNWAHGYCMYGAIHERALEEQLRVAAERCDSLQSFFLIHSLGGGTGSGLGTFILSLLEDHYPTVYRFTTAIFPSDNDDVVTSPYNSVLALGELIEHADCVLPIENQALASISAQLESTNLVSGKRKADAFRSMNGVASHLLTSLSSSMRFEGSLNIDLNEITTNLVPFPHLQFLLSSLSPLAAPNNKAIGASTKNIDSMFTNAFSRKHQLVRCDPKHDLYLSCALLLRGDVHISDVNRNIQRLRPRLRMPSWNEDGFKIGLCSVPPVGMKRSVLCLSNNVCIEHTFSEILRRFQKLYRRKAHVHHYTEYMELSRFTVARDRVRSLIADYNALRKGAEAVPANSRRRALV